MVRRLRLGFFGTPAFAVPSLEALASSRHEVAAVITQPDRPRGRGQHVTPEAVKVKATELGLPVLQPERLGDEAFVRALEGLQLDLAVVVAYGRILTPRVLAAPAGGFINVHASLLPRWRGAAPVHRAILAGDTRTGVTIMRVVQKLDAGNILMTKAVDIGANETSVELGTRLAALGAALLVTAVDVLADGPVTGHVQDEALATYASRLERRESRLDWAQPAAAVHNHIRGLQPWPMAASILEGGRIAFVRSEVASEQPAMADPGTVVAVHPDALDVAARPGVVRITELQPEGRRAMPVRAFLGGRSVAAGGRFEPLPQPAP
jgi:methionyl-tRNA formyltransferase